MDLINLILFLNCILGFSFGYEDPQTEEDEVLGIQPEHEDIYPPELDYFPKNIILFVASGMSVEAVVKMEIEIEKKMSEDTKSYLGLPIASVMSRGKLETYGVDFKPGNLESGLNNIFYGSTERGSCEKTNKDPRNIVSLAQKVGKNTGFITNLNVLSEVQPAFFGHEYCFDPRKSKISDPSCLLENAKLNVIFGQRRDDPTQGDQASNTHCSSIDEEKFVNKWYKEGFHRILFNSYDVNDNLTADGNVLGLLPNISKENFITLINTTKKLLKSNENGYFLVVYLKYPDVLKTLDFTMELFQFIRSSSERDTLIILTSEYACEGDCLEKYNTENSSLPTQNELEKEKDRELVEAPKQKENPVGSEETVKNAAEEHLSEPKKENSFSKESSKLTSNAIDDGSLEKLEEINTTSKEEVKSALNDSVMMIMTTREPPVLPTNLTIKGREELNTTLKEEVKSALNDGVMMMVTTREPPVLPTNLTIQSKPQENVEGGEKMEPPQTSAAVDSKYPSNILLTQEAPASLNLSQQLEYSKAGTLENEDQLQPTSNPSDYPSDSGSNSSFVDNLENKTSTEPSTRKRRELEPKISSDVPIYASGPMAVVFKGINKQNYLWIFLKMSLCADDKVAGISNCQEDPVINKYYDALFLNRSMKDDIAYSSAPGIFGKYLLAYLILACVSLYGFYF
ncbi:hypothetical protein J437_LFUL012940 [Ladona fulva]|uniref:alkaline phosphatase n=1 Tax=Ladona fulva TaxID=123851 RepID=A0A8K0KD77_LADFU|nr:hypothetical protein J437_LFUL012940 [Ladona fulva]